MKKRTKRKRISSAGRFRLLPLFLVVMAAASVAIGAVTVFSGRLAGVSALQKQAKGAAVAEKAAFCPHPEEPTEGWPKVRPFTPAVLRGARFARSSGRGRKTFAGSGESAG